VEPKEQPQEGTPTEPEAKVFDAEYVANIRKEAAKYRTEARQHAAELEKFRKAAMSESERAVAEAEARGRTTAAQEYGKRLARSEIRAAAADSGADVGGVFDYLDLSRFVGDDGEPDTEAVKAFVEALPRRTPQPPSLDLGSRGDGAAPRDFNQALRAAAGRA
jgi:hypothetical protein